MNDLVTRSISGIVYVALIVCSILFCGEWGFPILCALFGVIGVIEFHSLCEPEENSHPLVLPLDIIGMLVVAGSPLLVMALSDKGVNLQIDAPFVFFLIYLIVRLIYQLYVTSDKHPLRCLLVSLSSMLYIGLPLACASALFLFFGKALALTMFVMIWLNDTGAYIVGCSIGRHKLFPRISPKKSWEGFFGGMLFAVVCGLVVHYLFGSWTVGMSVTALCCYGVIVSAFATWGDLVESMVKRAVGAKDSGKIMPGHGGILDRIDSLLLVAPASLVYLFWLMNL